MPKRRRVYLLRHGDADYRADASADPPLSERGVAEAERLGRFLSDVPFDIAVATELRRTQQTAKLALGHRTLTVEIIPGLSEAKSGSFEDVESAKEMKAVVIGAFEGAELPDARFLTGEAFASVRTRATEAFQALIARSDWNCALVACHGVVNRTLLSHALGVGAEIYRRLEQDSGCVNILDIDGEGSNARVAYVRLINFTPYNATKVGMTRTSLELLWRRFTGE